MPAGHCHGIYCRYFLTTEAFAQRCSVKRVFLEISQNLQENTCARVSFLIKLQVSACEISVNTFFKEQLWATASVALESRSCLLLLMICSLLYFNRKMKLSTKEKYPNGIQIFTFFHEQMNDYSDLFDVKDA